MPCFFDRQSSESTVFQGLAKQTHEISTKLSTEILDFLEIPCQINDLQTTSKKCVNMKPGHYHKMGPIRSLDDVHVSDLCTQTVMQRNMAPLNRLSTKISEKFLQVIDS